MVPQENVIRVDIDALFNDTDPTRTGTNVDWVVLGFTQRVRVEVFDLLGRLVAVLYDEDTPAGRTTTIVLHGAQLATGAYIIRVQGETSAGTQKVTVVR